MHQEQRQYGSNSIRSTAAGFAERRGQKVRRSSIAHDLISLGEHSAQHSGVSKGVPPGMRRQAVTKVQSAMLAAIPCRVSFANRGNVSDQRPLSAIGVCRQWLFEFPRRGVKPPCFMPILRPRRDRTSEIAAPTGRAPSPSDNR
jgi:hypothetical protein